MDCSVFRKRLSDYIEGCISYDLKIAMENHLNKCEGCKDAYLTELYIDKALKEAVNVNNIEFSSIAADVMKGIDKTQYCKTNTNRLYYNFINHTGRYASLAAALIVCLVLAPILIRERTGFDLKPKSANFAKKNVNDNAELLNKDMVKEAAKAPEGTSAKADLATKEVAYMPQLIKNTTNIEPKFNTPWRSSVNNKYVACVEGIGAEAQEQGMSSIVIKELSSNNMWSLQLTEASNTRLNTPKSIEWWDDENLLVVMGYNQGPVRGGDLYVVNIKSSSIKAVYDIVNKTRRIVNTSKSNDQLLLSMEIYDENWNKSYKEQWILTGFNPKLENIMTVINNKGENIDVIKH